MSDYKKGLLRAARILSDWSVSIRNPTGKITTQEAEEICRATLQELWEQIIAESKVSS